MSKSQRDGDKPSQDTKYSKGKSQRELRKAFIREEGLG